MLRIVDGRSLRYSPAWDDEAASVLFDSNSGDYWVVSLIARALVQEVESAGEAPAPELIEYGIATARAGSDAPADDVDIESVLAQLVQLGILSHD